jgi:hypothetical protein
VAVDSIYMDLGATGQARGGSLRADIDMEQVALAVAAGYKVAERFELHGGLRYGDLSPTSR